MQNLFIGCWVYNGDIFWSISIIAFLLSFLFILFSSIKDFKILMPNIKEQNQIAMYLYNNI